MAANSSSFQPGHQAPSHARRKTKAELYGKTVRKAEKRVANRFVDLVDAALARALGDAHDEVINPRTGEKELVRVSSRDQQAAFEYLYNQLAGKPETKKVHEIGTQAQEVFQVLLGGAATAHWAQLDAPAQAPVSLEATVEVVEVACAE